MKFAKMTLMSSFLLVPTLAMGIAQQQPSATGQQQLRQDHTMTTAGSEQKLKGVIEEVRDDSFSLRTDDRGLVWFTITPELDSSSSSELVTGNRVQVAAKASDSPDRMNAIRVERADWVAQTSPRAETDTRLETDYEDTDRRIAQTETQFRDDAQYRDDTTAFDTRDDRDELPRTASSLPALLTLGLLALLGAAAVAFVRRF